MTAGRRHSEMTAGELVARHATSRYALRLYEERGLLAPRRLGGERFYGPDDQRRMWALARWEREGLPIEAIEARAEAARREPTDEPEEGKGS